MFALQKRPTLVSRSHVATVISRSRRSHSNTLSACGGSSFVARELDEPKKAVSGGLPSGDLQSGSPQPKRWNRSRQRATLGGQQRCVALRHLKKLNWLWAIAYRTRLGNDFVVNDKS
jgi:hypothetical protein